VYIFKSEAYTKLCVLATHTRKPFDGTTLVINYSANEKTW